MASASALATALLTDDAFLRYEGDPSRERVTTSTASVRARTGPRFSPDGTQLAVPDSAAGEIRIVDVLTRRGARVLPFPTLEGRTAVLRRGLAPLTGSCSSFAVNEVVGIDAASGAVRIPDTGPAGQRSPPGPSAPTVAGPR